MNHPHTTYAFLRICYPDERVALCRDWDVEIPLAIRNLDELKDAEKPWIYLWPRGVNNKPLLTRLLLYFKNMALEKEKKSGIGGDSWVTNSPAIRLEEVDREGKYVVYQLELKYDIESR